MQKSQSRVVVLPLWSLIAVVITLLSLLPAFLFCVREIMILKSRVGDQQLKISSLESITAQIRRQTESGKNYDEEPSQVRQMSFKNEVWAV